jgi:hypothetical protein
MASTGMIFAFTYMCTHFLHITHPPNPFPLHFPHSSGTTPPCWTYSALPYQFKRWFLEIKKTSGSIVMAFEWQNLVHIFMKRKKCSNVCFVYLLG